MFVLDICQFFTADPLPCDPLSLPKFPPSKEFDVKRRDKEATRYFNIRIILNRNFLELHLKSAQTLKFG
jgi:hypothetical protein